MELTSPKVIREIQNKFGFNFKKGLGQNFLTSKSVLEDICDAAKPQEGVLEIGPGFGVLTQELSRHSKKVVSIEIDSSLIDVLEYTLSECDNVKIVQGDVLKTDLRKLIKEEFGNTKISIAANLPYYITTPIITKVLEEKLPINNMVVMVQKEVAERLCAKPATKDYGAITLLCQYYCSPQITTIVPAGLFVPPPKVDSAVLTLHMLEKPRVDVKDEKMFFKTVKSAFSQRRKTLANCISATFGISKDTLSDMLISLGIDPKRRGETLSIDEFKKVADKLGEITN